MLALQMVRILQGGPINSVRSITQWELQNSGLRQAPKKDNFHLRPTAVQIALVTFSWAVGLLQTFYIWGP